MVRSTRNVQVARETKDALEQPLRLSLGEARGAMLAAQGLFDPPPKIKDLNAVQAIVDQLGVVQIDTINVVMRSQYLVLWSRLGAYDAGLLDALLSTRRAIFEYWSHAASIIPMRDYPYYRADMVRAYEHHLWTGILDWLRGNPEVVRETLERIRDSGPMASADFESPPERQPSAPWEWYGPKGSRRALHTLWTTGDLMISSRRGSQKVYDLRERVLAEATEIFDETLPRDDALPSLQEQALYFLDRSVRALGVVTPSWLWDYFRMRQQLQAAAVADRVTTARSAARMALEAVVERGIAVPVMIQGIDEPAYLATERLPDIARQRAGVTPRRTTLLSPFDNLIWHRARALDLFHYEVCFEAYVVPEKRRYGYYCLAILHHGRIVGRLDAKAVREQRLLLVHAIFLEPGIRVQGTLTRGIAGALRDLAGFLKLDKVQVERCEPASLAERLGPLL